MPSKSKKQSRYMTANCKSADFRKKTGMSKKVACDFHGADKGKYHENMEMHEDSSFGDKLFQWWYGTTPEMIEQRAKETDTEFLQWIVSHPNPKMGGPQKIQYDAAVQELENRTGQSNFEDETMSNDALKEKTTLQHALKTKEGNDTDFRAEDIGRMKRLAGINQKLDADKEAGNVDFNGIFTGVASGDIPVAEGEYSFLNSLQEGKKRDVDGDGDIDSDDYKAAKDKAIKKSKGEKVDEAKDEEVDEDKEEVDESRWWNEGSNETERLRQLAGIKAEAFTEAIRDEEVDEGKKRDVDGDGDIDSDDYKAAKDKAIKKSMKGGDQKIFSDAKRRAFLAKKNKSKKDDDEVDESVEINENGMDIYDALASHLQNGRKIRSGIMGAVGEIIEVKPNAITIQGRGRSRSVLPVQDWSKFEVMHQGEDFVIQDRKGHYEDSDESEMNRLRELSGIPTTEYVEPTMAEEPAQEMGGETEEGQASVEFVGDDGEEAMGTLYWTAQVNDGVVTVDPTSLRGQMNDEMNTARLSDDMLNDMLQTDPTMHQEYLEFAQQSAQENYDQNFNTGDMYGGDDMDGDHDSAMASAGFGTDEDYGFYGGEFESAEIDEDGAMVDIAEYVNWIVDEYTGGNGSVHDLDLGDGEIASALEEMLGEEGKNPEQIGFIVDAVVEELNKQQQGSDSDDDDMERISRESELKQAAIDYRPYKESEMFSRGSLSRNMIEMIVDEMNKGKETEEISEELSFDVDHVAKVVEFVKAKNAPIVEDTKETEETEEVDEGKEWVKPWEKDDDDDKKEIDEGLGRLKKLSGIK